MGKIKLVIYANQVLRAGVLAQQRVLAEIKKTGGIHAVESMMVPVARIFELQNVAQMKENEKRYLF